MNEEIRKEIIPQESLLGDGTYHLSIDTDSRYLYISEKITCDGVLLMNNLFLVYEYPALRDAFLSLKKAGYGIICINRDARLDDMLFIRRIYLVCQNDIWTLSEIDEVGAREIRLPTCDLDQIITKYDAYLEGRTH